MSRLVSHNPATNEIVWEGTSATASDVEKAVAAARAAFPTWASRSFEERFAIAEAYAKVLAAKAEQLATLIARETGKPLWDSKTEVQAMVGKIAISKTAYLERT